PGPLPDTFSYSRVRAASGAGFSGYFLPASALTYSSQTTTIFPFETAWQYNESRTDLGSAWVAKSYVDTAAPWKPGTGLLYNETAALPATKNTVLDLGPTGDR